MRATKVKEYKNASLNEQSELEYADNEGEVIVSNINKMSFAT